MTSIAQLPTRGPMAPTAVSVFDVYRSKWGMRRMAVLTVDTFDLIAAEPGVWLRVAKGGPELYTLGGWRPVAYGEYVVNYGQDVAFTASLPAAYVHKRYTREFAVPETHGADERH